MMNRHEDTPKHVLNKLMVYAHLTVEVNKHNVHARVAIGQRVRNYHQQHLQRRITLPLLVYTIINMCTIFQIFQVFVDTRSP